MVRTLAVTLSTFLLAGTTMGQTFSLDDNPSAPLTSAPFAGLFSAEDPFGLGLPAVGLGWIGPSPTLITPSGVVFVDGDILTVGPVGFPEPVLDVFPPVGSYLNAVSADHERYTPAAADPIRIRFSVDRATSGLVGTALHTEFLSNQQPGDIFIGEQQHPNPGMFVGLPGGLGFVGLLPPAVPGAPGFNVLEVDESQLFLTAGFGPGGFIPPAVPAPPIGPGTHDNVDAYNVLPDRELDLDGDSITDIDYFFSVPPASAFVAGVSAADIFAVAKGVPGTPPVPWAPAASLGLDMVGAPPNPQLELLDDVDGLVLWDFGEVDPAGGIMADPGLDYALVSLSEASASLVAIRTTTGLPVDGATVFFTDFSGSFAVYLFGTQLGVADSFLEDLPQNIDALEIEARLCDPCVLADVNQDGMVTPADFNAWVIAFNSNDPRADQNCDGAVTPADFNAWVINYNLCP